MSDVNSSVALAIGQLYKILDEKDAEIAALRGQLEAMQFVGCEDGLPEKDGNYLVIHQTRYSNAPWKNVVIPAVFTVGKWMCYGNDHGLCDYIIGWMALPAPPYGA